MMKKVAEIRGGGRRRGLQVGRDQAPDGGGEDEDGPDPDSGPEPAPVAEPVAEPVPDSGSLSSTVRTEDRGDEGRGRLTVAVRQ